MCYCETTAADLAKAAEGSKAKAAELSSKLEEETGLATGWHGCGAIRLAVNQEQAEWYRYVQAMLDSLDIESHLIGHDDIRTLAPLMSPSTT